MGYEIEYVKPAFKNSIHCGFSLVTNCGKSFETEHGNVKFFKTKFDAAIYRALFLNK